MPEISFKSLINGLPPQPKSVLEQIRALVSDSRRKIIVVDDDPTGNQSVHDISILHEWSVPVLRVELEMDSPAFFILTNSRSLTKESSKAINREIGANLKIAAKQARREFVVISRSDSTLRGYFPDETDALAEGVRVHFDGLLLVPYFREGGRYTINDIHYVVSGEKAFPVSETEFAHDPVIGFSASNLRYWVQEKTNNRIPAESVASLSIHESRVGDVLAKLLELRNGQICIVNAVCDEDIERVVLSLLDAEKLGKRFLYRTAASFVRIRAGIAQRPLLVSTELDSGRNSGGLVIIGSFVPKTNAQMTVLRKRYIFCEIELDVRTLLDDSQRTSLVSSLQERMNRAITTGQDVLLFTSRELVTGATAQESLKIEKIISDSLVACVRGLRTCPRYLLVKGGVTSSDVATKGLDARRAIVLGQILPGVPVWKLGEDCLFPGMVYVVFPGNVGDENALAETLRKLSGNPRTGYQDGSL